VDVSVPRLLQRSNADWTNHNLMLTLRQLIDAFVGFEVSRTLTLRHRGQLFLPRITYGNARSRISKSSHIDQL
jgi:hypothetical protein